jgi:hypothetical protein
VAESSTTARPLPPPLATRCPDCSICGEETHVEDGSYTCDTCSAYWPLDGLDYAEGDWSDPDAPQCTATVRPHLDNTWITDPVQKVREYRCVLTADHAEYEDPPIHADPNLKAWAKGWR